MKVSIIRAVLLGMGLAAWWTGSTLAQTPVSQNQWKDELLPEDHLLENLPWIGDDGKVVDELLGYVDFRGTGHEDLLLIYRQNAPPEELDKPHNQTFKIGFYNSANGKYDKTFSDEGGVIHWMRTLNVPDKKVPLLLFQRDDLKGNQALKGFVYEDGDMKQVLDATAPQVFANIQGLNIWCSSKAYPKDQSDAEHVLAWNGAKDEFLETQSPSGGMAGWSGASIAVPAKPVEANPVTVASNPPVTSPKPTHPSKNGWWEEPLDPQAASTKLDTELVPDLLKKGQIAVLGQKAKAFFSELQKQKTSAKDINVLRASYYAAVASTLLDMGNRKDAAFYLKTALNFQSDNPDALALKDKMK